MHSPRLRVLLGSALLTAACSGQIQFAANTPKAGASASNQDLCSTVAPLPGHAMIHRLDNVEYDNTVRDLLFTGSHPAATFASSSVGSSGFSNQSDVLTLSDQIVSDYAAAAIALADEALASKGTAGGAWQKLTGCAGASATPSTACVQTVVRALAERAYRRPIEDDDLANLMTVYGHETTFAAGFHDVIVAVLLDPRFLFVSITHPSPDDPTVVANLDDYELASRLSYFVWQSMPDDALITLAAEGTLHEPATLQAQISRMLADPRSGSFVTTWRHDWAHLSLLDGTSGYGGLPASLTDSLRQETQLTIQDLVSTDSSILKLVTSDETYVNADLAAFYGWKVPQATSSAFVKVKIPDPHRRGVLTQAAMMLTVGGGESYTHPVQRGRWVMDSLLCAPPGPPPAGVPTLDTSSSSDLPIRDRLAQHVASPACNGCHQSMDVYGLGLENFDMQGRWRATYSALHDAPIDASGTLPDGRGFNTPDQMLALLAADPRVQTCLATKLMSYALARPMSSQSDACAAQSLGAQHAQATSTLSELFTSLVLTPQFLSQQGAAQ